MQAVSYPSIYLPATVKAGTRLPYATKTSSTHMLVTFSSQLIDKLADVSQNFEDRGYDLRLHVI